MRSPSHRWKLKNKRQNNHNRRSLKVLDTEVEREKYPSRIRKKKRPLFRGLSFVRSYGTDLARIFLKCSLGVCIPALCLTGGRKFSSDAPHEISCRGSLLKVSYVNFSSSKSVDFFIIVFIIYSSSVSIRSPKPAGSVNLDRGPVTSRTR